MIEYNKIYLKTLLKEWLATMFPFFQSYENIPYFKQFLNIVTSGLIIAVSEIFNI